jgi:hypothetical protein
MASIGITGTGRQAPPPARSSRRFFPLLFKSISALVVISTGFAFVDRDVEQAGTGAAAHGTPRRGSRRRRLSRDFSSLLTWSRLACAVGLSRAYGDRAMHFFFSLAKYVRNASLYLEKIKKSYLNVSTYSEKKLDVVNDVTYIHAKSQ